jgi:[CysO sulfur-carrier protein]-S-L-cysteine hydrolase
MAAKSDIIVTTEALAEIYAHAAREYPRECCGIVFGPRSGAEASRVLVCQNIQDELHAEDPQMFPRDSHTAFNFDPGDLLKLNKSLRGDEPARIIYHSHPDRGHTRDDGAYFSATDQAVAVMDGEPSYPVEYLVVDVRSTGAHHAAQFAWDAEQKQYVEARRYP